MNRHPIIDCDGHLVEAPDLWERFLEGNLKKKAPRLVRDRAGATRILLEGRLYPQPEGKGKGFPGLPTEWYKIDDGGRVTAEEIILPQSRLRAMDTDGIDVAVPFPTLGLYTVAARDPELNAAICRAYNDWLAQEYPTAGLDRYDNFFMTHMISHPFEQMLAALSIIAGGVLERFPRLKVAFLESGCGWLPFWLHRMDEHYEKRAHEVPWLTMKPSEYF